MREPRCVKGLALYDAPGGIGHTLMGLTAPMISENTALVTGATFFAYECERVMQGTKTALHAFGNLAEFAAGVALCYALGAQRKGNR